MARARFSSEAELASYVVAWLEDNGWDVFKEVSIHGSGIADIVATQGKFVWIIETKLSLTNTVIEQAYERLEYCHYVSVATPEKTGWGRNGGNGNLGIDYFCIAHGIGRILVSAATAERLANDNEPMVRRRKRGLISERIKPRIQRPHKTGTQRARNIRRLRAWLCDKHRDQVAGAKGRYFTPYKQTVQRIRDYLERRGEATIKQIIDGIDHHYASASTARSCMSHHMAVTERRIFVSRNSGGHTYWSLSSEKEIEKNSGGLHRKR